MEQLVRNYIFDGKHQQEVVLEEDEDLLAPFIADFVRSMVTLSGQELNEMEIISKLARLNSIRFVRCSSEKVPHDITISTEEDVHSVYQLNLGLVEEVVSSDSLFSVFSKRSWQDRVSFEYYRGLVEAMATKLIQSSYPKWKSANYSGGVSPQGEIMGVLIDVVGVDTFFTEMVRTPTSFLNQINRTSYQEESLQKYLEQRFSTMKGISDLSILGSDYAVVDCLEAINDSQEQFALPHVKHK